MGLVGLSYRPSEMAGGYGQSTTAICLVVFFFSSRRRHTRFDCDWSSDVCSSDLGLHRAVGRRWSSRCATAGMPPEWSGGAARWSSLWPRRSRPHAARSWLPPCGSRRDRKSTRLNSSHSQISYAVFCLKKKKAHKRRIDDRIIFPTKSRAVCTRGADNYVLARTEWVSSCTASQPSAPEARVTCTCRQS